MSESSYDALLKKYFLMGFRIKEINNAIGINHDIWKSTRTTRRRLKSLGLRFRDDNESDMDTIIKWLLFELNQGIGRRMGSNQIWRILRMTHNLRVKRQTVRDLVDIIQPGRHLAMKKKRLCRRVYRVNGPNSFWHVDGNDKLGPYGFYISGAIDGWSHNLLWLKVDVTNKNPNLICHYYMEAISTASIVPRVIRIDKGTENVRLHDVQLLLREAHDDNRVQSCVIVGSSNHNQRIEKFWNYLRPSFLQEYMDLFKDMIISGIHNVSDPLDVECLKFCFMPVIRRELSEVMLHWNLHRMRKSKGAQVPHGIPHYIYNNPEALNALDEGQPLDSTLLDNCKEVIPNTENTCGCDTDFAEWAYIAMLENEWQIPHTQDDALNLYENLMCKLLHAPE